jgi:hypothetical protein
LSKNARIGLALRILGPALEIVCIGLLLNGSARDWTVFGRPLEPLLYIGVAVGLAMVAIGLGLTPHRAGPRSRIRHGPAGRGGSTRTD